MEEAQLIDSKIQLKLQMEKNIKILTIRKKTKF